MVLTDCPECARKISSQATECPGCGYPAPNIAPAAHACLPAAQEPRRLLLYSRQQIRLASILGTALAASHLTAANWRRLDRARDGKRAWAVGAVSVTVILAICAAAPESAARSTTLFALAANLAVADRMQQRQHAMVAERVAAGARTASVWRALGIAFAYLLLLVATIASLLILP